MKLKQGWIKRIIIFIPIIILTLMDYFCYKSNLTKIKYDILNGILILYSGYMILLYFFIKDKVIGKYLFVYLSLLQFFSFTAGMYYLTLRGIFPFNIVMFAGDIMMAVVHNPVYYLNLLYPMFNNIIQNSILYLASVLFYYKYIKLCEKKPISLYDIITILVTIINAQIGYQIYYINYVLEEYQHVFIVGLTFFLWLGGIYRQRNNQVVLKNVYRIGIFVSVLNIIYFVAEYSKIEAIWLFNWQYLASLVYFISDITITPFSIEGTISNSGGFSCFMAIILMLFLVVFSLFFYLKNSCKHK